MPHLANDSYQFRLCENPNGSLMSASVREICNSLTIKLTQISRRSANFRSLSNQSDRANFFTQLGSIAVARKRLPSTQAIGHSSTESRLIIKVAALLKENATSKTKFLWQFEQVKNPTLTNLFYRRTPHKALPYRVPSA